MTGNGIERGGGNALSEILKVNTTLTQLDLRGEEEEKRETKKKREKIRNE